MDELITKKYWKINNSIKQIKNTIDIIRIFIDKGTIVSIDQLNETIKKTLLEQINKLKEEIE